MNIPEIHNFLSFKEVGGELNINCIRNKNKFCEKDEYFLLAFIGNPFIKSENPNNSIVDLSFCVEKYKIGIENLANAIDGSFLMIFVDFNSNLIHVINDRFGVYPFFYNIQNSDIFGSIHSDEVGTNLENNSIDLISLGEFIRTGTITPEYSFYKKIKSIDYGNIFTFNRVTRKSYTLKYFHPSEITKKKYISLKEAYESMFISMKYVKNRYTNYFKNIGLLLSGGTDSRSIAIFFKDYCEAISLYTYENRSKIITKKVASLLDIKLEFAFLDNKQYINDLNQSVFLSGGTSSFIENHFSNLNIIKKLKKYELLISGCYFDYVFKGLTTNTKLLRIFGINFPYLIESSRKLFFYKKDFLIDKKIQDLVDKRRKRRFKNIRDKNLLEFERVAPLYLECENIGRRSLIFFTNWTAFVANYKFIEVMLKTPIYLKINTRLMRIFLFKNSGKLRFVPNSNTGVPIYPTVFFDLIHRFYKYIIRKFKTIFKNNLKNLNQHGSWVFSKEYIKQPEIEKIFWCIEEKERKIIRKILGKDIWNNKDFNIVIDKYNQNLIVRIITIAKWLELKRKNNLFKGFD